MTCAGPCLYVCNYVALNSQFSSQTDFCCCCCRCCCWTSRSRRLAGRPRICRASRLPGRPDSPAPGVTRGPGSLLCLRGSWEKTKRKSPPPLQPPPLTSPPPSTLHALHPTTPPPLAYGPIGLSLSHTYWSTAIRHLSPAEHWV